ncbi:MAG: hypothetical protein ACK5M4_07705 [Pseudorhodobacter sp.]
MRSALLLAMICFASPAPAQDGKAALTIEVNAAQSVENGCNLSFLVENSLDSDIAGAVFETVIFNAEGQVARMTLFDFGALPAGRPRVRQFVLGGQGCDAIGRILFNGAQSCTGEGLTPAACEAALKLQSRTNIEVAG